MVDPVTISDINVTGRLSAPDPKDPRVSLSKNVDFSVAGAFTFDFGTVNQQNVIGIIRSMFVDNGSNPTNIGVYVEGTDQYFEVPAYAQGTFKIDANQSSRITLDSDGGATDTITVTFYNYETPLNVWYRFGAFNNLLPLMAQGSMVPGTEVAVNAANRPVYMGGIDPAGIFRGLNVDATGNLIVSNLDITIGGIYGADALAAPPVHPGVLQAVLNSAGNIVNVQLNADGELKVFDNDTNTKLTEANVNLDSIEGKLTAPNTGAITVVASGVGDLVILAANANRKGAIVFNDSTEILRIALANVNATASWSIAIEPQSSFVLSNGDYTGVIKGTWVVANGSARVTEVV